MKKKKDLIKELKTNPKSKAILFFSFYFVLFTIVILSLRFGKRYHTVSSDYEKGVSQTFTLDAITSDEYLFIYTITVDGVKYEYYGEKVGSDEYFEFNDELYYKRDGIFHVKKDGEWVECETPYVFSAFLELDNIMNLLDSAYFDSKTQYNSGKNNYNYLITTNTVNKVIFKKDTDIEDEPNQIVLSSEGSKDINEVDFYLDDFCIANVLCNKSLKIVLQYDINDNVKPIDDLIKNN